MDIQPTEVESIRVIGELYGDEVKLIKMIGGFNVAIGKRERGSRKMEALAGGSHQALVIHQLSQQFKDSFEPMLAKSETEQLEKVEDCSNLLTKSLRDSGLEMYMLNKNNNTTFVINRYGVMVGEYQTEHSNNQLIVKNHRFNKTLPVDFNGVAESLVRVMNHKIKELGLRKITEK